MMIFSDNLFYSNCPWLQDANSLCTGEGTGMLRTWDERKGKDFELLGIACCKDGHN